MTEELGVQAVEGAHPPAAERHLHLVSLPRVADLQRPLEERSPYALAGERSAGGCVERLEGRREHPVARREEAKRPAEVAHHLRREHPPCGKQAGLRGNVDAADAERRRELGGVEGTRSAEGHQREATRIPSTLDRDDAYRALHRRVRHRHHAGGRRLDGPSQSARERRDRTRRPRRVDSEIAAQELGLHQPAEHEIRVRQSGSGAAPEAGRPRVGARAFRPHPERPTRIDPGERAAARPDGMDVHARHTERKPREHRVGAVRRDPVDDAHVRRRSTHVERDDAVESSAASPFRGT